MTAWLLIAGAAIMAVGIAFVYWPAAVVLVGAAVFADGAFDLRGGDVS